MLEGGYATGEIVPSVIKNERMQCNKKEALFTNQSTYSMLTT